MGKVGLVSAVRAGLAERSLSAAQWARSESAAKAFAELQAQARWIGCLARRDEAFHGLPPLPCVDDGAPLLESARCTRCKEFLYVHAEISAKHFALEASASPLLQRAAEFLGGAPRARGFTTLYR